MKSNQEFINKVWTKYDDYINSGKKDDFFEIHQIKRINLKKKMNFACSLLLGLFISTGIAYASVQTYNFIQKNTTTNFEQNPQYDYINDMNFYNGIYYKKITTYKQYMDAKKRWDNLVEVKKEDFNDSFILILAGENYNTTSLFVSNLFADDDTLYVELMHKDNWNESDTTISLKVSKDLEKENIDIKILPNKINISDKYIDINTITKDYSVEQARKEGCFIVRDNKVISSNKEQLNNFINNCKNEKNGTIRLYIDEIDRIRVCDIEYRDKKINMVIKTLNFNSEKSQYEYYTCKTINSFKTDEGEKISGTNYYLSDERGNNVIFCIIYE